MAASRLDITIEEGATFNRLLTLQVPEVPADPTTGSPAVPAVPIDLTGFTAKAEVRKDLAASSPVLASITANVVDALNGKIRLTIDATTTTSLVSDLDRETTTASPNMSTISEPVVIGVWDLELEDGSGNVTKLLRGNVKFFDEVAR